MQESLGYPSQLSLLHQPGQTAVCLYVKKYGQRRVEMSEQEIFFVGYLAYVGVMTKMVGRESLVACFWGCLVASDFLICSWRRCSSPCSRDMVRSLGMSCSVQSQCWPAKCWGHNRQDGKRRKKGNFPACATWIHNHCFVWLIIFLGVFLKPSFQTLRWGPQWKQSLRLIFNFMSVPLTVGLSNGRLCHSYAFIFITK